MGDIHNLFKKLAIPASFRLISVFFKQTTIQFLQPIYVKKCPSSIWYWDSNPQPSEHESPPRTTRPGLLLRYYTYYLFLLTYILCFVPNYRWPQFNFILKHFSPAWKLGLGGSWPRHSTRWSSVRVPTWRPSCSRGCDTPSPSTRSPSCNAGTVSDCRNCSQIGSRNLSQKNYHKEQKHPSGTPFTCLQMYCCFCNLVY